MPFSLQPNPSLYAKLAAQWEAEEVRRQNEAAARSYFTSQRNRFLILFLLALLMLQTSFFVHKRYVASRRQSRRQIFSQQGKDVEDVVEIQWSTDEKTDFNDDQPTK